MFITRGLASIALGMILLCIATTATAVFAGKQLPHGDEIAFMSYEGIYPDIFLMDVNRGLSINLTYHDAYDGAPSWSPDGEWIAFTSNRDGELNVFVMDATGHNLRRLTNGEGFFDTPRWSSDGQRLVFFVRGGTQRLYGVNFDGSGFQQLTSDTVPVTGVLLDLGIELGSATIAPSPDRTRTLLLRVEDNLWAIFLADSRRQNAYFLTTLGRSYTQTPVWSPEGDRIVFVESSGVRTDLYVVNTVDGKTRQLTNTPNVETSPAWRP